MLTMDATLIIHLSKADGLEKSTDRNDECTNARMFCMAPHISLQTCTRSEFHFHPSLLADYIFDRDPVTNRFISVPKNLGQLNCAAFVAGYQNTHLVVPDITPRDSSPSYS